MKNRLVNSGMLLAMFSSLLSTAYAVDSSVALTKPLSRAVFQRNSLNTAMVPIAGTYTGSPIRIEARALVMSGYQGIPADWQIIAASPAGGSFNTTMAVQAGGWYRIEVRAVTNGDPAISAVDRIGVGEVFITAGQSNSANHGTPAMTPVNDIVSAWTGSAWRHGYDPQPIATGTGGSPWSRLMDMLVNEFDVPVGFISVGVGGTAISRWIPTANDLYPGIQNAIIAAGSTGFRAILWHQGESDGKINTTAATYANSLNSIIAQSRVDAGWTVPWGVAIAAFTPNSTSDQQAPIRAGQKSVIDMDPYVFQGPDTDIWTGTTYRSDTVHFNALGLQLHAEGWRSAILKYVHPCDLDQDRDVDLADFAAFSTHWLEPDTIMAAHWELDATAGIIAADTSGNNHDGTLQNGPVWVAGKFGNALSFDGVDDYVEVPGYKGIVGTQSRTCCAWIKTSDSTQWKDIIGWGNLGTGQRWLVTIPPDGFVQIAVVDGYQRGTTTVNDGQWHYVVAVLADDGSPDTSEIKIYIDGIKESTYTTLTAPINTGSTPNVQIGFYNDTYNRYFKGLVDDVRIYETALSAQQIAELYEPIGDFDKNLEVDLADLSILSSHWLDIYRPSEARWLFDETTGLAAADSSGNRHDGTLINGPVWTAGKFGNALSFDGVDDYVEVSGYKGIVGTQSRTCSAWIRTDKVSSQIMSWGTNLTGQKWIVRINENGMLRAEVQDGYIYGTRVLTDNQWHQVAVVLVDDGSPNISQAKLYVDGQLETAGGVLACAVNTAAVQDVQLGTYTVSPLYFKGLMDDVRIYGTALSDAQISAVFSQ